MERLDGGMLGYDELKFAPVVPMGHSAAASLSRIISRRGIRAARCMRYR